MKLSRPLARPLQAHSFIGYLRAFVKHRENSHSKFNTIGVRSLILSDAPPASADRTSAGEPRRSVVARGLLSGS